MARGRCGKIIIPDELGAKIVLARLVWKDQGAWRAYECNICLGHAWHVTSQEQRTEKRTGKRQPRGIDGEKIPAIALLPST